MLPLARSLRLTDAVAPQALAEALFVSATRGTSLVRALLVAHAIDPSRLEQHLERGHAPYMRHVTAVLPLVQQLPPGLCERLLALPVRRDTRTGTVDVAVVDACDPHPVEEIAYWLKAPVRMVRTSLVSLDAAMRRMSAAPPRTVQDVGVRALAPPIWMPPPTVPPAAVTSATAVSDGGSHEVEGFELTMDPPIPFALTRKSIAPIPADVGPPAIERDARNEISDPVIDLRRRKTSIPAAAELPEQPVTIRGPFPGSNAWTAAVSEALPPPPSIVAPILEQIRAAHDRDAILELVLAGAQTVARRVAVLAVRRGTLVGWTCSSELAERADLRTVHLVPARTALAEALEYEGAFLVRIPHDETHAPLLSIMRRPPLAEVVLVTVRVEGKPVALVLADELEQPMIAAQRLEELARVAGLSMTKALRERRKSET
jgi:Type II secretion system (T2SS), protein E, N-terminal domain